MKELNKKELNKVNGATCISAPLLMVVDHFTGVCVGIKIN
ncbi:bacteriocin [Vibrio sp. S9_S30]|nr:bacteriocin [Vibrio sp. S9_S30]MBD1558535.1 bacteriocin [Vibrio sp. S9_S30]MBD1558537.1 bacteriocin [Vibrio sp. S9_S30]